jgi:hypothetical protein
MITSKALEAALDTVAVSSGTEETTETNSTKEDYSKLPRTREEAKAAGSARFDGEALQPRTCRSSLHVDCRSTKRPTPEVRAWYLRGKYRLLLEAFEALWADARRGARHHDHIGPNKAIISSQSLVATSGKLLGTKMHIFTLGMHRAVA